MGWTRGRSPLRKRGRGKLRDKEGGGLRSRGGDEGIPDWLHMEKECGGLVVLILRETRHG